MSGADGGGGAAAAEQGFASLPEVTTHQKEAVLLSFLTTNHCTNSCLLNCGALHIWNRILLHTSI